MYKTLLFLSVFLLSSSQAFALTIVTVERISEDVIHREEIIPGCEYLDTIRLMERITTRETITFPFERPYFQEIYSMGPTYPVTPNPCYTPAVPGVDRPPFCNPEPLGNSASSNSFLAGGGGGSKMIISSELRLTDRLIEIDTCGPDGCNGHTVPEPGTLFLMGVGLVYLTKRIRA